MFRFVASEWDEQKRRSTLEKHGIDFLDAVRIFEADVLVAPSGRRDLEEKRWIAIELLDGIEIAVIFTVRGESCRVITARRARRDERKEYHARFGR